MEKGIVKKYTALLQSSATIGNHVILFTQTQYSQLSDYFFVFNLSLIW